MYFPWHPPLGTIYNRGPMADLAEIWKQALPTIQQSVTGRGVWAALNASRPVAMEDGIFILGVPREESELGGHLRLPQTQRLIETIISRQLNAATRVTVIDGILPEDYELYKRRAAERRRLQEAEMSKMRQELQARTSWDSVYEQLSRRFAAVTNKSLPQNKARFYEEAIELIAEARRGMSGSDDMQERNYARCLERAAQYTEVPSTILARHVMQRAGEL